MEERVEERVEERFQVPISDTTVPARARWDSALATPSPPEDVVPQDCTAGTLALGAWTRSLAQAKAKPRASREGCS